MPVAIWAGCAGVTLAGPANWFVANQRPGLLALAGSLAVFAIGTAVAWRRREPGPRHGLRPAASPRERLGSRRISHLLSGRSEVQPAFPPIVMDG